MRQLAENNNLDYIETTSASNGYPSNIEGAIGGFDNFKQAKEFADENDMTLIKIHKRDGWGLWARGGWVNSPFHNSSEDYGDNYTQFQKMDEDDFLDEEVHEQATNFSTFDELENFITKRKNIFKQIEDLEDGQILIVHEGIAEEVIDEYSMGFSHDTHHYMIVAVK